MDTLSVNEITFHGVVNPKAFEPVSESLVIFSYEFEFGKSYLLDAKVGKGAWALSWIIGCILESASGEVNRNGSPYGCENRKADVWCVHRDEIKRFGIWRNLTVKSQILHGLRTVHNQYLRSEKEIMEAFRLTPERYNRPFSQLSNEAWRASCAVGLAHGKKIFCFPHMGYFRPDFYEEVYQAFFKDTVDLLKASEALVLIPAQAKPPAENLCDEVISIG